MELYLEVWYNMSIFLAYSGRMAIHTMDACGHGIMSAKGRVKWPDKQLPSLLEQMLIRTFDERMRPRTLRVLESEAFEALPVTCSNVRCLVS